MVNFARGDTSGPLPRNFKHTIGILSSSPVDCDPFWANWVKGGSVYISKSQRHKRSGAGRGVSQANGAVIQSKLPGLCQYKIVEFWKKEAMWSCASQLWVPSESCGDGRPYLSFCPITLQHCSFRSWWVCRWMQNSKRSRMVPFLFGWGHWKGSLGGGWSLRGVHPIKYTCLPKKKTASWLKCLSLARFCRYILSR